MPVLDFASCGPHMFATKANGGILEMRLKLVAVAGLFALSATGSVQAMEMRQKDADDFRAGFLSTLPDSIAKSDFLTVKPAGNRLEAVFDFSRLLEGVDPQTFAVTGLSPWSLFITPQDNGVVKLDARGSVYGTAKAKARDGTPINGSYKISSLIVDGILSATDAKVDVSTKGVNYLLNSNSSRSGLRAAGIDYSTRLNAKTADQKHWDMSGATTFTDVYELVSATNGASLEIGAAKIHHNYNWTDVPKKEFTSLVTFILGRLGEVWFNDEVGRDDKIKPSPMDLEGLRRQLAASVPLLSTFADFASARNLVILSPAGNLAAGDLGYQILLQGKPDAMQLTLQLSANALKIDSPMIPASYSALVPSSLDIDLRYNGLDFASAGNILLTAPLLTEADAEKAGERTVDSLVDKAYLSITELKVKSSIYDLSMFGEVHQVNGNISQAVVTVWAYNFDRSIAAVQNLIETKPELNSLNMGMIMAKGIAKTDADDGSLRWTVVLFNDGSVTVNGQLFRGPVSPEQKN